MLADVIDSLALPPDFNIEVQKQMPILETDTLILQQVFSNLLSNAIKHRHKPDGQVRIAVKEQVSFYEFSISDDGPGIDAAYHKKVFEIFQVLDNRDRTENTGIDLSIVKKNH